MLLRARAALVAIVAAALSATPALAQGPIDAPSPDRHEIMILTAVIAVATLTVASVGFLYRRIKGMVPPPEQPATGEHH